MEYFQIEMTSPLGPLYPVANEMGLKGIFFEDPHYSTKPTCPKAQLVLKQACDQLNQYFQGSRTNFDLPLNPSGTDFQKKVWKALYEIPYGQTRSYKDIAIALNQPNACRAVGSANGKNPICVIIPCHRVITSGGKLGGYSGGLDKKTKLLEIENINL